MQFELGHPRGGAKYKWGRLKSAIFDQYFACYISEMVQDMDMEG